MRQKWIWVFAVLTLASSSQSTRADSLDVSYTYSGTPGDYTLNFALHNNLTSIPKSEVSVFGFLVDQGTPSVNVGYDNISVFNTVLQGYGTSYLLQNLAPDYNNVWNAEFLPNFNGLRIQTGSGRSGFLVHTTSTVLPTSVQWFAFTFSTVETPPAYAGGDPNFYYQSLTKDHYRSLGFEGIVSDSGPTPAVPEPTTFAMTGLGCIVCAAYLFRRRASCKA